MILKFCTKINRCGNRMFLTVDTVEKVAEISYNEYYSATDCITIPKRDITKLYIKFCSEFVETVTA